MVLNPDILWTVHAKCNNHGKLAGNSGKKNICFRGCMVSGVLTSNAHIGFEVVDGSFYGSSYFIEGIPFNGITLNPRKHAKFHVFIGVSSSALLNLYCKDVHTHRSIVRFSCEL